jgi:UDP-glucose 4-epimerase
MKALVTGGAGFIGSHVVDELARRDVRVVVYDDFSTGFQEHLERSLNTGLVEIVRGDILDPQRLAEALEGVSTVFHLAANADVRGGMIDTAIDLERNVIGTHRVLEAMRTTGADRIVFTSSATVYGEPELFPTPESYAPLQTSAYGASKLAAEAFIEAYSEYFGITCHIFRFVSWIGERYSHGVVYDFVRKLLANNKELEILGDGSQTKSYLHVEDGIQGIFCALENLTDRKNVVNLGHEEHLNVKVLADIVCDEMGLGETAYRFTGGSRGWVGDSPFVHLDISKVKAAGFRPRIPIEEGIRRTVRYLMDNPRILQGRNG